MPRRRILCALLVGSGALLMNSCVSIPEHQRVLNEHQNSQKALAEFRRFHQEVVAQRDSLQKQLDQAQADLGFAKDLKARKSELDQLVARLKKGFGHPSVDIQDVEVIQGPDGVALSIQGEVLFSSGQANLSGQGKTTLTKVAEVIKREGNRIRVNGHTDTDPIRKSKVLWQSNLHLSAMRAVQVAEYLAKRGVSRGRIEIAGFGPARPRDRETTEAAKRRNRRVEIVLLNK